MPRLTLLRMDSGFLSSDACVAAIRGRPLPLDSSAYVHRPPQNSAFDSLEAECAAAIATPGALVRIKGARQTGKTSLVLGLARQAQQLDYATGVCDLQALVATEREPDLDAFLYSFCRQITQVLGLPDQLDDYWDDLFGSAIGCKSYFEEYLLPTLERPLLLTLDDIDSLFPFPQLADEFFGLLRAWHEEAKTRDLWKRLRLVVAHATEVYLPLNLNKSPFNVGVPVELPPFEAREVDHLAQIYGLSLPADDSQLLNKLLGGWPHLIHVALHQMVANQLSPMALAESVTTQPGPFATALGHVAEIIVANPLLAEAMVKVLTSDRPVEIAAPQALKLQSLGIARRYNQAIACSCSLYRTHLLSLAT
ncbi:serine/threonine protein kinase [filamentous cyanobacterium CCP5]|nr:serine/threonine protein kinase [filamentous cyanobacterium CCP5]